METGRARDLRCDGWRDSVNRPTELTQTQKLAVRQMEELNFPRFHNP